MRSGPIPSLGQGFEERIWSLSVGRQLGWSAFKAVPGDRRGERSRKRACLRKMAGECNVRHNNPIVFTVGRERSVSAEPQGAVDPTEASERPSAEAGGD